MAKRSKKVVGWSMDTLQDRHLVLRAVLMALWQREDRSQPVVLHSDHGTHFTCEEYQQFLAGHNLVCSMSASATAVTMPRPRASSGSSSENG